MSYYAVLQLPETCTAEEIRATYLRLAQQYHPDRHIGSDEAGEAARDPERFKQIQEAYETLYDKDRRAAYDRERSIPQPREGARAEAHRRAQAVVTPINPNVRRDVPNDWVQRNVPRRKKPRPFRTAMYLGAVILLATMIVPSCVRWIEMSSFLPSDEIPIRPADEMAPNEIQSSTPTFYGLLELDEVIVPEPEEATVTDDEGSREVGAYTMAEIERAPVGPSDGAWSHLPDVPSRSDYVPLMGNDRNYTNHPFTASQPPSYGSFGPSNGLPVASQTLGDSLIRSPRAAPRMGAGSTPPPYDRPGSTLGGRNFEPAATPLSGVGRAGGIQPWRSSRPGGLGNRVGGVGNGLSSGLGRLGIQNGSTGARRPDFRNSGFGDRSTPVLGQSPASAIPWARSKPQPFGGVNTLPSARRELPSLPTRPSFDRSIEPLESMR